MEDYRQVQIAELDKKIEETKALLLDPQMRDLAEEELQNLEAQKQSILATYETNSNDETASDIDQRNVIIEISGAAGGDEAALWGKELLRMYGRFAEVKGYKVETLDDDVIKISGNGAFENFKYEAGVHRVQRIPATEKRGRVHTSTATVSVLPELEDIDLHINPGDIDFEAFRAGGHGGQNVNKVSSAVRIVHRPSGLVVTSRAERSQLQNREIAMELLRAKLWEAEVEKQHGEIAGLKSTQVGTGSRAEKIRTFNFPQDRLTDHRIKKSWSNLESILDGNLGNTIKDLRDALESSNDENHN